MQTASSRVWIRVTKSTSNNDNRYAMSVFTSIIFCFNMFDRTSTEQIFDFPLSKNHQYINFSLFIFIIKANVLHGCFSLYF